MAFVELVDDADVGEASDLVDADRALRGYVPNYTRALARRPEVYRAWRALIGAITADMDERRYELATLAAARRLRSSYCALAHGKVLADKFLTSEEVAELARGRDVDSLDEVDRAVLELADKVAVDATTVTPEDVDRLARSGLPTRT
jgi:AhpD family alkylhydroperoxidase